MIGCAVKRTDGKSTRKWVRPPGYRKGAASECCAYCKLSSVDLSACRAGKAKRPTLRCTGIMNGRNEHLAVNKHKVCDEFKKAMMKKEVAWKD